MKKKTLILQFFLVFFAMSEVLDLAEKFYIWAVVRETGVYVATFPHVFTFCLLGMLIGAPMMIGYVRSLCDDLDAAMKKGIDMMAAAMIGRLLKEREEKNEERAD